MTIVNGYATLEDLKAGPVANITSSDSVDDAFYEAVIEAASRDIDDICHRRFYSDSDATDRYYTAKDAAVLFVDDICSPSSDVTISIDLNGDGTFDQTFAVTDFTMEPFNAEADGLPYQKLIAIGQYSFPKGTIKGVKVNAKYGWTSVPTPIQKACLLHSYIIIKYYSTPLGLQSISPLGVQSLKVPNIDPRVMFLLSRYIKPVFG